jgi:phage terminase large subunit-like protein
MATMLLQRLEKAGITCVDIPQTFLSLTDPLNQIEILLKGRSEGLTPDTDGNGEAALMVSGQPLTGRMTHEDNPVARWCFGNTSVAKNGQGYIKFVKEHKGRSVDRTKRIDLTAAWVDAMARARYYNGNVDLSAAILSDDWGM